jgi:hypothetical protein
MPEAATKVVTSNTVQIMLDIFHDRIAIGVTRVVRMAAVLRRGKQLEKLQHYYFSWRVSFQKQEKREMVPLERKQSAGKSSPHSDLRWLVIVEEILRFRSN